MCDKSRTVFVSGFSNFLLLWVSNINKEISFSTLNYQYVEFLNSVKDLLSMKILIKGVVDNL